MQDRRLALTALTFLYGMMTHSLIISEMGERWDRDCLEAPGSSIKIAIDLSVEYLPPYIRNEPKRPPTVDPAEKEDHNEKDDVYDVDGDSCRCDFQEGPCRTRSP